MESGQLNVRCECTPEVDTRYDTESDRSLTWTIVAAIAEATGDDPDELPPLYEFVDSAALENLLDAETDLVVSFRVETWNVFVRGDGRVRVCDATTHTDPKPVFAPSSA